MNDLLDRAELLSVLQGYNPWWGGRPLVVPKFRRIAFQVCHDYLAKSELQRAIHLSGPRRVGKTTILFQIAESLLKEGADPKSICYISLDHPLLKIFTLPKILKLYHESTYPQGKPAVLLLDEVQYSSDWELHIKQLVDHNPEYRILATGSASVAHHQKLTESGVGRWLTVQIPTLSFYEFLQIRGERTGQIPDDLRPIDLFKMKKDDLSLLATQFRPLMPLFQRYLLVGGFPETARQNDSTLSQRLLREDVVERVIKRDMASLFGIRSVNDLEKLFIYICLNSGGLFVARKCADALELTRPTVLNHLEVLKKANLIYLLPPYAPTGKKVLKAQPKVYLVDAALRNAVLLRGEEVLNNPEEMGTIAETTVLRHLFAYHYRDVPQITYWRDAATQKEVDIIVRSPAYLIPVEVKYREKAPLRESEGIVAFCGREKVKSAYWVTRREEDFDVQRFRNAETAFLRVPAHIFVYLLGQAERLLW